MNVTAEIGFICSSILVFVILVVGSTIFFIGVVISVLLSIIVSLPILVINYFKLKKEVKIQNGKQCIKFPIIGA
jgi:5-bromo-4-chloroindolyl phosphate hydrolysis protein